MQEMMTRFLVLAFVFFIGCISGWCLEVLFRRFISANNPERRWINPGFLIGPYLPLYGFGLTALYLIANVENTELMGETVTVSGRIILFLIMAVVMTVIEYIAGLIFIKGLHVQLWDYKDEKFNIQGIICPKFSLYWAVIGAVYYFCIHRHILSALRWFAENNTFSFFIGIFFGVFFVDLGYSLNIVSKVKQYAIDNDIIIKYEKLRNQIMSDAEEKKEKIHFFRRFSSRTPLREHLERYIALEKAFNPDLPDLSELKKKIEESAEARKEAFQESREAVKEQILSSAEKEAEKFLRDKDHRVR